MKSFPQKVLIVSLFAITMGFLESIVVVYLRELYYPGGFRFPLTNLPTGTLKIETVREITTLVMLACIGILAGKTKSDRIGWFLFSFGVWDIFYYVGLKLMLGWPASVMEWDVLFLVPVVWLGPVLAPVLCSVTMIFIALPIIYFENEGFSLNFGKYTWTLFVFGTVIIIFSFLENYIMLHFLQNAESSMSLERSLSGFIPEKFNWLLFSIGEFFILGGAFHLIRNYLILLGKNK